MAKTTSSIDDVLGALPAVQQSVRDQIAARIEAGETIATVSSRELLEKPAFTARKGPGRSVGKNVNRKSAA